MTASFHIDVNTVDNGEEEDLLPRSPVESDRVVVIGTSGSGKSIVAAELAAKLDCPFVELDELFWAPGWQPKPTEEFLSLVRQAASGERWVCAGNYGVARPELWPRANTIVWLNLSRAVILRRIIGRTVRRLLKREVLWHGNQESVLRTLFTRQSIVWWAITTHNLNKKRFGELRNSPQYSHLRWYEFTRPAEVERFLAAER